MPVADEIDHHERDLEGLGEVIAALAHEIRNPLTGISINVQYLQMAFAQTEAQKEIYADILESIGRLDSMIREFVEFTQTLRLRLEKSDLNKIFAEALSQQQDLSARRRVHVSVQFETALPEVDVDVERFRRALAGLIEHSIFAAEEGGLVVLSSGLFLGNVSLSVEHNGRSLSPAKLEQLFDPVAGLKGPETGFGLAFVRKILHAHRCQIEVESVHGGQTRLIVLFPLHVKSTS